MLQTSRILKFKSDIYLLQPINPMIEAKTVTTPVTANDLRISFELLFQVIAANTAILFKSLESYLNLIQKLINLLSSLSEFEPSSQIYHSSFRQLIIDLHLNIPDRYLTYMLSI